MWKSFFQSKSPMTASAEAASSSENRFVFSYYTGLKSVTLPVAAYARKGGERLWEEVPELNEWLRSQPQPIDYRDLLAYFKKTVCRLSGCPSLFNKHYLATVQLLALLAPPISVELVKSVLTKNHDVFPHVYGVIINAKQDENLVYPYLMTLSQHITASTYDLRRDEYYIWLTGANSDFPLSEEHTINPLSMLTYWQSRMAAIPCFEWMDETHKGMAPLPGVSLQKRASIATKQNHDEIDDIDWAFRQ